MCLAHQNFFGLDPEIKKNANIFILYKPHSRKEITCIEDRVGMDKGQLKEIFKKYCDDEHDSICVDHTKRSPARLRLNVSTPIQFDEG